MLSSWALQATCIAAGLNPKHSSEVLPANDTSKYSLMMPQADGRGPGSDWGSSTAPTLAASARPLPCPTIYCNVPKI